jgi:hypothetical protein
MLPSHTLPPAARHRNAAVHADDVGRIPAVGLVENFPRARFPAALSPEVEPLWKETLASVGINSNSRFFTDCYHQAAAIHLLRVEKKRRNLKAFADFLRSRRATCVQAASSSFWKIHLRISHLRIAADARPRKDTEAPTARAGSLLHLRRML